MSTAEKKENARIIKAVDAASMEKAHDVLERSRLRAQSIEEEARQEARAILAQAREEAGNILKQANTNADEMTEAIRQEEHGRAASKAAVDIAGALSRLQGELDKVDEHILGLVRGALTKIMGEMDDADLIEKLVREGIRDLKDQYGLKLLVHSSQYNPAELAVSRFHSFIGHEKGPIQRVEVDSKLRPGDCHIVSSGGLLDISVESQIDKLLDGLRNAGLGANEE